MGYSATFRGELVNSTLAVLGAEREHFSAGAISVQPKKFEPLVPTTTATSTSTSVTSTQPREEATHSTHSTTSATPPSSSPFTSAAISRGTGLACVLLPCLGLVMSGIGGA